jgi:hypothetical protein
MSDDADSTDRRIIRFAKYEEPIDLAGVDLIGLSSATREQLRAVIPSLRDPGGMTKGWAPTSRLEAMNGEIADEVHAFANATKGAYRLKKVLLREGIVIEVQLTLRRENTSRAVVSATLPRTEQGSSFNAHRPRLWRGTIASDRTRL